VNSIKTVVNDIPLLTLAGRFDAHEIAGFSAWATSAAERRPARAVVDLSEVTFVDSAALTAMVSAMKRLRMAGGDLHLCGIGGSVQVIFELTRLNRAFTIHPGRAEAVAAFGAEAPSR
jgi:anti-anti-sigma factor